MIVFVFEGTLDVSVYIGCVWSGSPKHSVPERLKSGRVEGTDEYEEQEIQAHHDGKMMSDEPRRPSSMSEITTECHISKLEKQAAIIRVQMLYQACNHLNQSFLANPGNLSYYVF